jgi:hypothetical protein
MVFVPVVQVLGSDGGRLRLYVLCMHRLGADALQSAVGVPTAATKTQATSISAMLGQLVCLGA